MICVRTLPRYYKQEKLVERVGLEDCWCSVIVSCCYEKLVADAGDILENPKKGNVRRRKPLPSND
jgi:hypothetical protein